MGAEAEVIIRQTVVIPVLDVQYPNYDLILPSGPGTSLSQTDMKSPESAIIQYSPTIRSGSFADIGPRRHMEDQHIRIDDLSMHLGSNFRFPKPNAFYGVSTLQVLKFNYFILIKLIVVQVFDGHGGPEASAYVQKNVNQLFFQDVNFPQSPEVDDAFLEEVESSLCEAFLLADAGLADECSVSSSSGTTALTAIVLGSILMVANAGDCRAVLCRKGKAIDMSQDHRPSHALERKRIEELGGFIDDGYLNGNLSVTRSLGDWDMKLPRGSPSPLIADPDIRQIVLTEYDEFLIIGCDGIWDVMSSQQAVSLVRRGLRRHDDPGQCARDLVMEALRLNAYDNLTVIVVCFTSLDQREASPEPKQRLKCCSLSAEALCSLRSLLDGSGYQ